MQKLHRLESYEVASCFCLGFAWSTGSYRKGEGGEQPSFQGEGSSENAFEGELQFRNLRGLRPASVTYRCGRKTSLRLGHAPTLGRV
jgi:hypothetical protein